MDRLCYTETEVVMKEWMVEAAGILEKAARADVMEVLYEEAEGIEVVIGERCEHCLELITDETRLSDGPGICRDCLVLDGAEGFGHSLWEWI